MAPKVQYKHAQGKVETKRCGSILKEKRAWAVAGDVASGKMYKLLSQKRDPVAEEIYLSFSPW